jgi:hypothetical protein
MDKFPRAVVWGTIAADILLLVAIFIWFLVQLEFVNVGCVVLAVLLVVGCVVFRKQIETACVILKVAMEGLFMNRRVFLVTFGVQLVWVGYFAIWIASLIGMHFVKEVRVVESGKCELRTGWTTNVVLELYWILQYYWVTAFCQNICTMMITANLAGWFFEEQDFQSFWVHALKWSLGVQAGGNAMCAAITGFMEYLLSKVSSPWKLCLGCLNPFEWIFICIGLALKTVALTFSKFALIAMTISGNTFCGAAPEAFKTLRSNLGEAVITDYIGKRVMAWCTYFLAVGVAFAAWAWADTAQGLDNIGEFGAGGLAALTILFAIIVSYPLVGLVVIVLIEQLLSTWTSEWGQDMWHTRATLNSIFAALFMGCVTQFVLDKVSGVVVTAMDVLLFCIAIENNEQERFANLYSNIKETFPEANKPPTASVTENNAPAIQAQVVGSAA